MRPSALTFVLVVTALSACGNGSLGTSGAGGPLPACTASSQPDDSVSFAIAGPDGMQLETAVSAAVTVVAVESCPAVGCPMVVGRTVILPLVARIRLQAATGEGEWTLYLLNSAMPADAIKAGDTFDMTVDARTDAAFYTTTDQTIVLARAGNVMLFAAALDRFGSPPVPDLLPFGIAVTDAGAICESPTPDCDRRPHALRVSIATDANVVIASGQTGNIGGMSITNGRMSEAVDRGGCDLKSSTTIAGFRLP